MTLGIRGRTASRPADLHLLNGFSVLVADKGLGALPSPALQLLTLSPVAAPGRGS